MPNTAVLTNATHTQLIGSGNAAYIQLYEAFSQSKEECTRLKTESTILRDEVTHLRQLASALATAGASSSHPSNIPVEKQHTKRAASMTLRLSTPKLPRHKDRDVVPEVPWYAEDEWVEYIEKQRKRGKGYDKLGFLVDEDGEVVSKSRLKEMSKAVKMLWNQLRANNPPMHPPTWAKKTTKAKEYVFYHMLTDFPEFLLGDGHWKLERFATIRYPDWTTSIKEEDLTALNNEEYDLYMTILNDLAWTDDTDSGQAHNDAYYEQIKIGIREARGWLRGRYAHLPPGTIDSILRFFLPDLSQGDVFTGGQFFAGLRLVVHAENGKEIDRALAFVQAHPSASGSQKRASVDAVVSHHDLGQPPPTPSSSGRTSNTPTSTPPMASNPFSATSPDCPASLQNSTSASSSFPLPRANPPPPPALSHLQRARSHPNSKSPPALPPHPPVPPKPAHVRWTLMKQSLQASKAAQTMKRAEAQLEQERVLQVLKSSMVVSGTQVRTSCNRSINPNKVVVNVQGPLEATFHQAGSVSRLTLDSSEEGRGREGRALPLPRRRNTHTQQQPSLRLAAHVHLLAGAGRPCTGVRRGDITTPSSTHNSSVSEACRQDPPLEAADECKERCNSK
ncbi:hypothetical protein FPV67DRAFT_1676467 [Lyophyllum atratum]|nr:hypothetical protein FPV67DRAFT_1676467 [Lyophyllum atratum]